MGDPTSPMCIQKTSSEFLTLIQYVFFSCIKYYNIGRYFILSVALNNSIILNKLSDFENQLPSSKERQLKKIANLVCGIRLYSYNIDQKSCDDEIFNSIYILYQNNLLKIFQFLLACGVFSDG